MTIIKRYKGILLFAILTMLLIGCQGASGTEGVAPSAGTGANGALQTQVIPAQTENDAKEITT